ncbi:TlpA family protein disulfide reductase [Luteimonas vadosa]|uniref:TlpA disulfide reductase family protein n=1 Tax=Luteimonas vadosa TaxID=1165507 RepID=A0ABP9DWV3_9GAMM
MRGSGKVLLVAFVAATLGVVAGFAIHGPGPLLRTEWGQHVVQSAIDLVTPAPPGGLAVATRGQPVPAIPVRLLDGGRVVLPADFTGRPLLVNVWASWCGPCIAEMPELQRFSVEQGDNGVQVVGIALDEEDAVRAFLARVPVSYPIAVDAPGPGDAGVQLGNRRGVLPYSVLISAEGRLLKQQIGPFEAGEIDAWVQP